MKPFDLVTKFLLISALIFNATCYDITSDLFNKLPEGGGQGYVAHDGMIYIYGGSTKNVSTNDYIPGALHRMYIDRNAVDEVGGGFRLEYLNSFGNYGYGQLLLLNDNQTLLTIGGENLFAESTLQNDQNNQTNQTNQTTQSPPTPPTIAATMKLYHISNNTWSDPRIANASEVPINRARLAAAVAPNGLVYVIGGDIAGSSSMYDFFSYNPVTGVFTSLDPVYQSLPYLSFPGTCASLVMKPDGNMLLLFGNTFDANFNPHFTGAQQVHSFNTNTNQWTSFNNTNYPDGPTAGRLCPTVMMNPSKTAVYAFGGGSSNVMSNSSLYNDMLIYNLTTNTWSKPQTVGNTPVARMFAAGGFLDDNHLLVASGNVYGIGNHYLDVLRLPSDNTQALQWVSSYNEDVLIQPSNSIDGGKIAAIVICTIIGITLIALFLWRFGRYLRIMILNLHYDIWRPRTGEPLWAETMRVISQVILFFLFLIFAVFIGKQVHDSPRTTLTIDDTTVSTVYTPNVRICVEGTIQPSQYFLPQLPEIQCQLPNGQLCSSTDFRQLDLSIFRPDYGTDLPNITCSYFNAGNRVLVGSGKAQNGNTSAIQFNIYANLTFQGAVHVDLFPPNYDPIEQIYFGTPNLMPEYEVTQWKEDDRTGGHVSNSYDLLTGYITYINYQLINHKYLKDDGWNYIGLLPKFNDTPELDSTHHTNVLRKEQENLYSIPATYVRVKPQAILTRTLQEQKLYSVISALSYMGGLFSLFLTFQTLLFGYRPTSPWGLVHRWSIGELKRSISQGLVSRFQALRTPVPLVNPVSRRFSTLDVKSYGYRNIGPLHGGGDAFEDDDIIEKGGAENEPLTYVESEENRMTRMENRLQLLELLFKSYYINDEVFKSLDKAIKKEEKKKRESLSTLDTDYQNTPPSAAPLTQNSNDSGSDEFKNMPPPPPFNNNNNNNNNNNVNKAKKKNWMPNLKTNTSLWDQNKEINDDQHEHHRLPRLTTPTRDFNPIPHHSIQQQQDLIDNSDHQPNYPNSSSTYNPYINENISQDFDQKK
ncbi:unnamed protein product [Cunninghamella blakesleeana]